MEAAGAKVQHVAKASSDQLLRKFAELEEPKFAKKLLRVSKRRKKSQRDRRGEYSESPPDYSTTVLVERRSLLPPATRRSVLLRQLGIGRSQLRARDFKNKSLLRTIEKTWHQAVEGASKIFVEKHYNRHKRLISDIAM